MFIKIFISVALGMILLMNGLFLITNHADKNDGKLDKLVDLLVFIFCSTFLYAIWY